MCKVIGAFQNEVRMQFCTQTIGTLFFLLLRKPYEAGYTL
jgi:hypothetical protein